MYSDATLLAVPERLRGARRKAYVLAPVSRLQRAHAVHVVAVRVRCEDVGYGAPAGGFEDGAKVPGVGGARVDHRERLSADEIGIGALEGERAGVVGDEAHDAWRDACPARHRRTACRS